MYKGFTLAVYSLLLSIVSYNCVNACYENDSLISLLEREGRGNTTLPVAVVAYVDSTTSSASITEIGVVVVVPQEDNKTSELTEEKDSKGHKEGRQKKEDRTETKA